MSDDNNRVLVADDEPAVLSVIEAILEGRGDCEVDTAADGQEAFEKLSQSRPDVLITDLRMPRMSGEILSTRALELHPDLTVLVETGNATLDGAVGLMREGVYDVITKPFVIDLVERTVSRAIDRSRQLRLEPRVDACLESLMNALGRKDPYLRTHGHRVSKYCKLLGQELGLGTEAIRELEWVGLVHDIGKIGVPDAVLLKPDRLTEDEFAEIERHPEYSAEIIAPLATVRGWTDSVDAVRHHHERWDGAGYPDKLKGEDIPFVARVVAVCDAYDAMASARPYQAALDDAVVLERLEGASGTQLDAELVRLFLDNQARYKTHVDQI